MVLRHKKNLMPCMMSIWMANNIDMGIAKFYIILFEK